MNTPSPAKPSYEELAESNAAFAQTNAVLLAEVKTLKQRLEWFIRHVHGERSEKFRRDDSQILPLFADEPPEEQESATEPKTVSSYTRKKRGKTEELGDNQDNGLRFDDGIEIVEEEILPAEVRGLSPEQYKVIGFEISDRLGSRTTKLFVHRRKFLKVEKVKIKQSTATGNLGIIKAPVSDKIFPGSYLSVGFIADMFQDKCLYSIPLYRQHQRLKHSGVHLARSMLSNNFIRYAQLLQPLMLPHQQSILLSRNLAIDETPMRVGVDHKKHKMKKGYIWPMMGDAGQIIYVYNESREAKVLEKLLKGYHGTILSDGYSAYKSYVNTLVSEDFSGSVTHATCWVHARRKFEKLGNASAHYQKALGLIAELYAIEKNLKSQKRAEILKQRNTLSQAVVDRYFEWLKSFQGKAIIATNELLRNAVGYSLKREESMRVFLRDPELALDTNYLEREIRPIAIGRKNFMFCWTEIGAESLCTVQSLIRTCLMQGIKPREYLVDVMQRIAQRNPEQDDISDLIPAIWKDEFKHRALKCPAEIAIEADRAILDEEHEGQKAVRL